MRLGKDALVLTKCARSQSAGFLSQSFLKVCGRPALAGQTQSTVVLPCTGMHDEVH